MTPNLEPGNPKPSLRIGLMYPFAFSYPAFHCCLLKGVLGVITVGHRSWLPTPEQVEDSPYPPCNFMWLLCFGKMTQQRYQLP